MANRKQPDKSSELAKILFDPENQRPVILRDARGTEHRFVHVATVSLDDAIYALLTPHAEEGIARGGVFAFLYDPERDDLECVVDEERYERIYREYQKLFPSM